MFAAACQLSHWTQIKEMILCKSHSRLFTSLYVPAGFLHTYQWIVEITESQSISPSWETMNTVITKKTTSLNWTGGGGGSFLRSDSQKWVTVVMSHFGTEIQSGSADETVSLHNNHTQDCGSDTTNSRLVWTVTSHRADQTHPAGFSPHVRSIQQGQSSDRHCTSDGWQFSSSV